VKLENARVSPLLQEKKMYYYVGIGLFGDRGYKRLSWLRYWYYRLFTDYVVHKFEEKPTDKKIFD